MEQRLLSDSIGVVSSHNIRQLEIGCLGNYRRVNTISASSRENSSKKEVSTIRLEEEGGTN